MTGKWHVTGFTSPKGPKDNWPLQRGFEKFYGTITGAGSYYDPTTLCRQNTYITPLNDPKYRPKRFYYTDAITDNAVAFINEHFEETPDKPFFIYIAYTAAHWPMHALPEDISKYRGMYDQGYRPIREARYRRLKKLGLISEICGLSPQAGNWKEFPYKKWEARCMEVYAAMIERMDRGIGKVVEALKKHGALDNTLIFFLQDNGGCAEGIGREVNINKRWTAAIKDRSPMGPNELQRRIWPPMKTRDGRPVRGGPTVMPGPEDTYIAYGRNWANVSNTPFREYKHWVHEGGISTPLIVHWPAGFSARGEIRDDICHLIDIMATCVDIAGATYPTRYKGHSITPLEGISLLPAFQGKKLPERPLYWEHEANCAIRIGRWKLVCKGNMRTGERGAWELYDMKKDRAELHDLSKKYPERVKEMAEKWEAWAKRAKVKPWPWGRRKRRKPNPANRNR